MSELGELRRQLRIAYGLVIEDARLKRWPVQSAFAEAVEMSLNTYRRTESGERAVSAPELDVIAHVLGIDVEAIRAEAWQKVRDGEIPSQAERAAGVWRNALNPKQPRKRSES